VNAEREAEAKRLRALAYKNRFVVQDIEESDSELEIDNDEL
jgi:hypothetical protein